jgi:6-phosphofructokinase 1
MPRTALLFSGGPAPAANAVIASAASTLRRGRQEVVGIRHGYRALAAYDGTPLVLDRDYVVFADHHLWGLRARPGIFLGTGRVSPGRAVRSPADLLDPDRTAALRRTWQALVDLDVDALISIGGDGTLMTANIFHRFQRTLPADARRVRVVHVPKTIDNDYDGIDFTFGFFTAVDEYARQLRNLREDALATDRYYVAEVMGRRAGWLAYAASIAGEAHLVIASEDVTGALATEVDGERRLDLDVLVDRIVDLVQTRERKGKAYGVIVLAEGLAELLPPSALEHLPRGEHGEPSLAALQLGRLVAERAEARFAEQTGHSKRIVGLQLGYEARCAAPHAFDLLLGSQLGVGAAEIVLNTEQDGVMVSVGGQLTLRSVPFDELVDQDTLRTEVRLVEPGSDFHRLAHTLQTRLG